MITRSSILVAIVVVLALGATGCSLTNSTGLGDTAAPAAVVGVTATVLSNEVHVAWAASSEADLAGYQVRRTANGGAAVLVGTVIQNAFVDANIQRGSAYRYDIAAYDQAGNVGPRVESTLVVLDGPTRTRRGQHTGD